MLTLRKPKTNQRTLVIVKWWLTAKVAYKAEKKAVDYRDNDPAT